MYGLVTLPRALLCAALFISSFCLCSASYALVISQVYGGGGNSGASYSNDFIEIFNNAPTAVDLTGISVQYASATGTTWHKTDLSGSLAAYHYYLIQEAAGSHVYADLPQPDAVDSISLSTSSGKVALVSSLSVLPSSSACLSALILDLVGYGSADCFEGTAAAGPSTNGQALSRLLGGLTDSNDNFVDFSLVAPTPRNSAFLANAPGVGAPGDNINAVREPASLLLLAAGLAALPRRWRRATPPAPA